MMLVGDVKDKTTILVDDLADTSNTITRAAKLLKKEGATKVYALVTHGILSGDAIDRINASALDKVVVTNSVDQTEHLARCPKLEVLEVGNVFAEVCHERFPPPSSCPWPCPRAFRYWQSALTSLLGYPSCAPRREHQRVVRLQLGASTFGYRQQHWMHVGRTGVLVRCA